LFEKRTSLLVVASLNNAGVVISEDWLLFFGCATKKKIVERASFMWAATSLGEVVV
jgi:hypothetical protein